MQAHTILYFIRYALYSHSLLILSHVTYLSIIALVVLNKMVYPRPMPVIDKLHTLPCSCDSCRRLHILSTAAC
jgi:hypothetical protein